MLTCIFFEVSEIDFITTEEDVLQALNKKEVGRQYSEDYPQERKWKIDKLKDQSNRRKHNEQGYWYHDSWGHGQ